MTNELELRFVTLRMADDLFAVMDVETKVIRRFFDNEVEAGTWAAAGNAPVDRHAAHLLAGESLVASILRQQRDLSAHYRQLLDAPDDEEHWSWFERVRDRISAGIWVIQGWFERLALWVAP